MKLTALKSRAQMLARTRDFFAHKEILEVDCPALSSAAPIDVYIDLMEVKGLDKPYYLHSSPEYGMKRLLAEGVGDIYQLSHVFRSDESGRLHNPEFTMVEWYRLGFTYEQMIEETLEYIALFTGTTQHDSISYREAFINYAGIDYVHASNEELLHCLAHYEVQPYPSLASEGKDAILNLLLHVAVEPHLQKKKLCLLQDYPASQAALARTRFKQDEEVAERFEIFYQGIELANGYHELTDVYEQKRRLEMANAHRIANHKSSLPIDKNFLKALEKGIPDCSGVAVGFDRLLMIKEKASCLSEILPFDWNAV